MVASNKTDPSIGAVDIPHEGPEEYNNIWQKVRSMWSYVYDNYYEEYDWFHIGGDDLFLIVENLRLYLESEEIQTASNGGIYLPDGTETMQTPLFMGRRFAYMGDMKDIFNSGGSGYTMNKAAVKRLVVDGFPNFFSHMKTFSEDTMIARMFRHFGVYPYETKDDAGGERYMPFMPGHHYGYRMPQDKKKDWYAMYSINIKEGTLRSRNVCHSAGFCAHAISLPFGFFCFVQVWITVLLAVLHFTTSKTTIPWHDYTLYCTIRAPPTRCSAN
jgi:glycoprotein-N-acetylgalactosamine 3-beta-galactosyltransferase